jgi:hypothetical protein
MQRYPTLFSKALVLWRFLFVPHGTYGTKGMTISSKLKSSPFLDGV